MAKNITDAVFETEVLNSDKLVVLDFWAEWCGPCKQLSPIIDELSNEIGDGVLIGKVSVDENDEVVSRYAIRNIPTILFIKNGVMLDKLVGLVTKNKIVELINKHK